MKTCLVGSELLLADGLTDRHR